MGQEADLVFTPWRIFHMPVGNMDLQSVKEDSVTWTCLPAFWIVEVPLTVDHPTERTVEVQCHRHPTAITLDIQPCDMIVMMVVQRFQCIDGQRVSTCTISQPLLGCGQLQLFKSITLVYNYNKNCYRNLIIILEQCCLS